MKRSKILMLCLLCGICVIGICVKQSLRKKFYDYNVIAHAGGGIDGHIYTDSLEAINNSYDNGARLFDIDLRFTSDLEIVLRHDWTGINLEQPEFEYLYHIEQWSSEYCQEQISRKYLPTMEQFKNAKIFSCYTPLSFRDIVERLQFHPDAYMVLDVKEDAKETYSWIVDHFKENKNILDQLIVSCYDVQDLEDILNIYPFKHIMLRQHAVYPDKFDELVSNCEKYNVKAVNINLQYATDEKIQEIRKKGIKIFWAVENDLKEYQEKYLGDGVVSDWITENQINELLK